MRNLGRVAEMQKDNLNIYNGSFLDEGFDNHMKMLGVEKFDVVVMNPPYQELKPGFKKSQALWDKFVLKVLNSSVVEGGYLVAIHPDGWRNIGNAYEDSKNALKNRQILFLCLNDLKMGVKTFGSQTAFDFYCVKNVDNQGNFITKIKCMDGTTQRVNISQMEFIPNGMFEDFKKLLAKPGEEKVEVLYSRSDYGTDKKNMSKEQTEEFKYPVVYVTYKDGSVNFLYSNTNTKGHFGIPKVIWSNGGASTPVIDKLGEYGLTQFAYAIIDKPENLENIKKAMLNPKFMQLMSFSDGVTGVGRHRYNRKAISLFRKDFWVDFLDYDETTNSL